jgi:hypothetical protein
MTASSLHEIGRWREAEDSPDIWSSLYTMRLMLLVEPDNSLIAGSGDRMPQARLFGEASRYWIIASQVCFIASRSDVRIMSRAGLA